MEGAYVTAGLSEFRQEEITTQANCRVCLYLFQLQINKYPYDNETYSSGRHLEVSSLNKYNTLTVNTITVKL